MAYTLLLPEKNWPVRLLRDLCRQHSSAVISGAIGVSNQVLEATLDGAEGANNHDWLVSICRALELDVKTIFRTLVSLWLAGNNKEASSFARDIAAAARRL